MERQQGCSGPGQDSEGTGYHVHIGRVNTKKRFSLYEQLGADTCDGSGIAMYDHMLEQIERHVSGQEVSESLFGSMT